MSPSKTFHKYTQRRRQLKPWIVVLMTIWLEIAIGISTFCWGISASGVIGNPGYLSQILSMHGMRTQWGVVLCVSGIAMASAAAFDLLFEVPFDKEARRHVLIIRARCSFVMIGVWLYVISVLAATAALFNVAALTIWSLCAMWLSYYAFLRDKQTEDILDPHKDTAGLDYT